MDFICGATARGYMYAAEWYGTLQPHFQVFQNDEGRTTNVYMLQNQAGMHVHKQCPQVYCAAQVSKLCSTLCMCKLHLTEPQAYVCISLC